MTKKTKTTAPAAPAPAPETVKLLTVSPETGAAIAEWAAAAADEGMAKTKTIDLMYAEGLRPHHCIDKECPEGSPERGIYLEITARIKAGLLTRRPDWAAALALPAAGRKAPEKKAAADAQAAVGPYRANLRNALLRRCEAEKAAAAAAAAQAAALVNGELPAEEGVAPAKRGFNCEKLREDVAVWIKRLSKDGVATDFDRDAALADLKSLQVRITVK